ncbi:competence protein TfoX [Erysipelothrix larvae]|uniref:Competence protein TfoX n=1 Tax=Erysipelothrix larvae TaxID=1514105 RepID=A0A0X8H1Y9_9FIRM|nr:TfoX/Sxy family protein [Erysipelothrix larvae]AMC94536.1 competence protein TfoX [Erysipelothrix larvae]
MASSLEFVEYVCDQMEDAGMITYKRMFGEFGVYCNGKIIGLICEDQLFVKPTQAGAIVWEGLSMAPPYPGAKPYYVIESLDDRSKLTDFVIETYKALPEPKPKKKKV